MRGGCHPDVEFFGWGYNMYLYIYDSCDDFYIGDAKFIISTSKGSNGYTVTVTVTLMNMNLHQHQAGTMESS
jgi:hypothetical protein